MLEFPHLYGWGFLSSLGEKVLDTAAPRVHYGHHDTSKGRGRRGHVRRTTRGDGCRLRRRRRHHLYHARRDGGQVAGAQAMSRPRLSVVRDEEDRSVLVLLSPDELGKVCAALAAVNVGGWLSPLLARLNETAAAHRPMHVDSDPTPPRGMPRPGGAVS